MTVALALGIAGQSFFAARMTVQWIASERAGKPTVPRVFWTLSVLGAVCMIAYAASREDVVFVASLLPSLFVYARNLTIERKLPVPPAAVALLLLAGIALLVWRFPLRLDAPPLLATAGLAGTVLFAVRFPVQWWIAERRREAVLPPVFWWITLGGGTLLTAYAAAAPDWLMVLAYAFATAVAVRNLWLARKTP